MRYKKDEAKGSGPEPMPEGIYDATLASVANQPSKKDGVNMEVVQFDIYGPTDTRRMPNYFKDGVNYHVRMYRDLASALGKSDEFEAEKFQASNYIGSNLCIELTIEDNPPYGRQNRIKTFHPKGAAKAAAAVRSSMAGADKPLADEDIPF